MQSSFLWLSLFLTGFFVNLIQRKAKQESHNLITKFAIELSQTKNPFATRECDGNLTKTECQATSENCWQFAAGDNNNNHNNNCSSIVCNEWSEDGRWRTQYNVVSRTHSRNRNNRLDEQSQKLKNKHEKSSRKQTSVKEKSETSNSQIRRQTTDAQILPEKINIDQATTEKNKKKTHTKSHRKINQSANES